jgi:MFS family permease
VLWDLVGPAPTYVVAGLLGAIAVAAPLFVPATVPQRVRLTRLPGMVAEVARQRAIVGSWVAALAIGLPWGAVSGLFPLFGTGIGLTAGTVGLLMASQSVANGLSRVPLGRTIDRLPIPPIVAALTAAGYGAVIGLLGLQGHVALILLVLVAGIVMLAFTLMLVQVTISEVARPEVRATGLGGYGTALSAGLGLGPALGGAIADTAGFGWAFATIGVAGVAVAAIAALVLAGTRRRPSVVVFE